MSIGELPSHNHSATQPSGYTNHRFVTIASTGTSSTARRQVATGSSGIYTMTYSNTASDYVGTNDMNDSNTTANTGSGTRHNNLQPWISVYCWARTL